MPTVREIATVRPSQALSSKDAADPIAERSWLVWTAMKESAERGGEPERDAQGNLLYQTSLMSHLRFLYPDDVDWTDKSAVEAFTTPVYTYLRTHGIAKVVQRNVGGDTRAVIWAIAPNFTAGTARRLDTDKGRLSKREARLTPQEVGEDRTPEPVTVRKITVTKEDSAVTSWPCTHEGCDRVLTSKMGLYGHLAAHKPKKPKASSRPNNPFVIDRDKLAQHRAEAADLGVDIKAVKTGDPKMPFACSTCGKRFAGKHGLGGHMKLHIREAYRERLAALAAENAALRAGATVPAQVATSSNGSVVATAGGADLAGALAALSAALGVTAPVAAPDLTDRVKRLEKDLAAAQKERDEAVRKVEVLREVFAPVAGK